MSLRAKVVTLLLVVFAGYAAIEFAIQRWVVYPRFLELEREEALKNVERAVEALQRDLDLLVPSVNDWGLWDDTYQFVQDRNAGYIESNLNFQALQGLEVNVMAFYDRAGAQVWAGAYNLHSGTALEVPALLRPNLPEGHFLVERLADDEPLAGIVQTASGPMLMVARPVLTSDGEGPPMGSVLMARLLDATAITRLGAQARVDLRVLPPERGLPAAAPATTPGRLVRSAVSLVDTPVTSIGQTTVMDIRGDPVLTLMVTTTRAISARGEEALWFARWSLAVAGGLVLVALILVLRRSVLDPLWQLTRHAAAVGATEDLSLRVASPRRDELGVLAREFDRMVERLAETRQRLVEQSYRAGVAEMASGVLHNIGNAMTPVGVTLGNLRQLLRDAPVEEIDLAVKELADPGLDAGRRADMQHFIELASGEMGQLLRRTAADLARIQAQVDHVQQALADQQRYSRAERVIEAVEVGQLVRDAAALLPEDLRQGIRLELDPQVERLAPLRTSRVALQQVVTNLLINAAEAVGEGTAAPPIEVRVGARILAGDGAPMLELQFADTGAGVQTDHLPRLFERGFTTKPRGSGMGLHWCANTVAALGGSMRVESAGVNLGACVHVLLPAAVESGAALGAAA